MKLRRKLLIFILPSLALVAAGYSLWPPKAALDGTLETSGRIEGEQAAVAAKVAGAVASLLVAEGARVEEGALIAQLDSQVAQAELRRAEHLVHAARQELAAAHARVPEAKREAEAARSAVTLAREESRTRIAPMITMPGHH
ncbi:MAG: biotin/lipoyl-binding protein [Candidatus Tectomicrobia bacterium]|nr:biotin/lipoyl-binding protein [Candidatus Tectomicrobia bacterium]